MPGWRSRKSTLTNCIPASPGFDKAVRACHLVVDGLIGTRAYIESGTRGATVSEIVGFMDGIASIRGGGNRRGTRANAVTVRKLSSRWFQARSTGPDGDEHRAPTTCETKGVAFPWLTVQSAAITERRWKLVPPDADGGDAERAMRLAAGAETQPPRTGAARGARCFTDSGKWSSIRTDTFRRTTTSSSRVRSRSSEFSPEVGCRHVDG